MKIKIALLIFLLIVISAKAQIYTPSGIIQGASTSNNIGIGATSPLGKLDIAVGSTGTFNPTIQSDGSISIGNSSAGSFAPHIAGKSSNSIGLYLHGLTADINTNPDMIFGVRGITNSDFTTLTTSAFRFLRFTTPLVDILRNGNVGIMSVPVVSPNNTSLGFPNGGNIQSRKSVPQLALSSNIDGDWYNATYKATGYAAQIVIDPANMGGGANGIAFNLASSGTAGAPITWQRAMTIVTNGNVGIGTTSPVNNLGINMPLVANSGISLQSGAFEFARFGIVNPGINNATYIGSISNNPFSIYTNNTEKITVLANGNVGIGTTNPTSKLTVAGNINSREVKVTVDAGADFVFENNYNLPSLYSVDRYIKENKHLPEIASADEMKKEGINLSEMNIKLLQKIEELTLYTIEQQKNTENLTKVIEALTKRLEIVEQN